MRAAMNMPAPALLLLVYLSWIVVGTALLMLPISSTEGVSFSDAFFTSTSAVTVTGLAVVDTGSEWTRFGQGVLMLLIQLGGMGLMTFAVIVLSSLGLKIGLPHRRYLREEMGLASFAGLVDLVWTIFRIVLICEVIGIVLLSVVFVPEFGWKNGL